MKAAVYQSKGTLEGFEVRATSPQHLARTTGFLYLSLAVFGMFSQLVLEALVVPGDAAATANNILGSLGLFGSSLVTWMVIVVVDVAISATFYLLLEPVSRALSLIAAAFRFIYSAMLGVLLVGLFDAFSLLTRVGQGAQQRQALALSALETFSAGFLIALVFFGVHLLVLGFLLYRSHYVPRVFGVLLVAAGVGYIADGLATFLIPDYGGLAAAILLVHAIAGELGLTTWLLIKGVKVQQRV